MYDRNYREDEQRRERLLERAENERLLASIEAHNRLKPERLASLLNHFLQLRARARR